MKPCHTGAAYICEGYTEEKEEWKRKKQYYCFKCDRPIEYNGRTYRWVHIKVTNKKKQKERGKKQMRVISKKEVITELVKAGWEYKNPILLIKALLVYLGLTRRF